MSENSRIAAQSKRIAKLLTMNRDEQRRRLKAEAERDALWMRCQNYRLGGARTGDEWDALIAERDRLRRVVEMVLEYEGLTDGPDIYLYRAAREVLNESQ